MFSSPGLPRMLSPSELCRLKRSSSRCCSSSTHFPQVIFTLICPVRGAQYCVAEFCHGIDCYLGCHVKAASSLVGKLHPQRRTLSNATCDLLPIAIFLCFQDTAILSWNNCNLILAMFCLVNLSPFSLTSRTPNQRV